MMIRTFQILIVSLMIVVGLAMLFDAYIIHTLSNIATADQILSNKRIGEWLVMITSMTVLLGALIWSRKQ
jgi:hypothetical protein